MKLIIDIPKNAYDLLQGEGVDWLGAEHILDAVAKGKPVEECEDCVSLDAVIDVFDTWWAHNHESDNAIEILEDKLNALPPVTPAEKVGHWEWVQYDSNPNIGNWHCSECRSIVIEYVSKEKKGDIPLYKYCPQCGCKIQEVEE